LVTQENAHKKIKHFVEKQGETNMNIDIAVVSDEYMGTADVLRSIRDKIKVPMYERMLH
jgi:hypothetical protein